jgi:hypothetical protein
MTAPRRFYAIEWVAKNSSAREVCKAKALGNEYEWDCCAVFDRASDADAYARQFMPNSAWDYEVIPLLEMPRDAT